MKVPDQIVKLRIVLLTAALSVMGFFLEVSPVGGAFGLENKGGPPIFAALALEFAALGFLAYLALAASAAIGLHLGEDEPTPKEEKPSHTPLTATGDDSSVRDAVRLRPELHQLRMLFTALGGYALLKGISLALMWPQAAQYGISPDRLVRAFEFGFIFTALGWFLLWQFLRWYAIRRRWIRLQAELIGVDVTRIIALVVLCPPVIYLVKTLTQGRFAAGPLSLLSLLLYLTLAAAAGILWFARPLTLRRTLIALSINGAVMIVLTLVLGALERYVTGG